jgi:hypothetical protein
MAQLGCRTTALRNIREAFEDNRDYPSNEVVNRLRPSNIDYIAPAIGQTRHCDEHSEASRYCCRGGRTPE